MGYTLNIRGRLLDTGHPLVMGILNVTPDSFYADSRVQTEEDVARRARQIAEEGGTIIDVGACSTRPGSVPVDEQEETARLRMALTRVRKELPEAVISVDTFRPAVARIAVEELGADIVNNVGEPWRRATGVPCILTSSKPTMRETMLFFASQVQMMHDSGQKDIILDPGFGFGKNLEQNYQTLAQLEHIQALGLPVLVGLSRKSMIYRALGGGPEEALTGTTALHAVALMKGASILRAHDVKEAVQTVRLIEMLREHKTRQ